MMHNVTLYTIKAVIILDSEGNRLLAKYYKLSEYKSVKDQKVFEKNLYDKTRKSNGEIMLYDGHVICYRSSGDVTVYFVGMAHENEWMIAAVLNAFTDALSTLLKHQLEKRALQENYDLAILALDETIDQGIVLEVDPTQIVNRVSKRGNESAEVALAEQTLVEAYQAAKQRFTSSLLK
jgi:hypothetical protein